MREQNYVRRAEPVLLLKYFGQFSFAHHNDGRKEQTIESGM